MAYDLTDLLAGLQSSRKFFLKHLNGLTDEQWTWKPYPECKSILETVAHLVGDDRAALDSLQSGKEPDYVGIVDAAHAEAGDDREKAQAMLAESHTQLCDYLTTHHRGQPLDVEICVWGHMDKLAKGVAYFSSEDYYHAGQVAYIRMASDPTWDYYASIYGG